MELVVRTLRGGPDADDLSWRDVAERTFFPTRWRPGYEPDEVDAAMEKVARELRRRDGDA
jgi:DivIVA domain-containing protein